MCSLGHGVSSSAVLMLLTFPEGSPPAALTVTPRSSLPGADMFLFCPQPMSSYTLLAENSYIKMVSEAWLLGGAESAWGSGLLSLDMRGCLHSPGMGSPVAPLHH